MTYSETWMRTPSKLQNRSGSSSLEGSSQEGDRRLLVWYLLTSLGHPGLYEVFFFHFIDGNFRRTSSEFNWYEDYSHCTIHTVPVAVLGTVHCCQKKRILRARLCSTSSNSGGGFVFEHSSSLAAACRVVQFEMTHITVIVF
jgi:hypothetical protein